MRNRSNTVAPMTYILRRDEVGILGVPTTPTAKRLFMSHVSLDLPAFRTGCAGVSRVDHDAWDSYDSRQQRYSIAKESRCMTLPSDESLRVLNCYRSTRGQCYEHQLTSFLAKQLLLKCTIRPLVDAMLLLHSTAVSLFLQDRAQILSLITVRTSNASAHTNVNANSPRRFLYLSQWHGDRNSCVPLAILPKDFCRLIQRRAWKRQGAVDGAVSVRRHVKAAIAPPLGRCTPQHHPQIKAFRFSGLLDLSTVNQLRVQETGGMTSFSSSLKVDVGATVCTPDKFAKPFCAGEPDLFRFRKASCDIRMGTTEQVRQKRQRVCFVGCRIELQLVGKIHGCHVPIVAEKNPSAKSADFLRADPSAQDGEPRLRFGSPMLGRASLWKPASKEILCFLK